MKFATTPEDAVTTVEVVGGTRGAVTLDADKNAVLLIKNKDSQSIEVVSTKGSNASISKTYSLSGLVLESNTTLDLNEETDI